MERDACCVGMHPDAPMWRCGSLRAGPTAIEISISNFLLGRAQPGEEVYRNGIFISHSQDLPQADPAALQTTTLALDRVIKMILETARRAAGLSKMDRRTSARQAAHEQQENLRPQLPAAQQDKTDGRSELPHRDRIC